MQARKATTVSVCCRRNEYCSPSTPSSPQDTRTEMVPLSSVVNFEAVDDD